MSFWDVLTWMFDHPKATNHFKSQSVLLGGRVAVRGYGDGDGCQRWLCVPLFQSFY